MAPAIAELYLQGFSSQKIEAIIAHLRIDHFFPSLVSRIAKNISTVMYRSSYGDPLSIRSCISPDASYYTVRDVPRYVSKALLVTAGVCDDG